MPRLSLFFSKILQKKEGGNVNHVDDQIREIIKSYKRFYKTRYGKDPLPLDNYAKTIIKDIIFAYGFSNAQMLVEGYLSQDGGEKQWFVQRGHDFPTLKKDAGRVWAHCAKKNKTAWIVGKTVDGEDVYSTNPDILRETPYFQKPGVDLKNGWLD